jgi:hypothetical protein
MCFSWLRMSPLTLFSMHFRSSMRNPRVGSPCRPSTVRPSVGRRRREMDRPVGEVSSSLRLLSTELTVVVGLYEGRPCVRACGWPGAALRAILRMSFRPLEWVPEEAWD